MLSIPNLNPASIAICATILRLISFCRQDSLWSAQNERGNKLKWSLVVSHMHRGKLYSGNWKLILLHFYESSSEFTRSYIGSIQIKTETVNLRISSLCSPPRQNMTNLNFSNLILDLLQLHLRPVILISLIYVALAMTDLPFRLIPELNSCSLLKNIFIKEPSAWPKLKLQ